MPGRLPDFFVVGANRAGTTSLYHHLRSHPEIFMCEPKEPSFFAFAGRERRDSRTWKTFAPHLVLDEHAYRALFDAAGERLAGEASTAYLDSPVAPQRIRAAVPSARIVISLRDPVECFVSRMRTLAAFNIRWKDLGRALAEFDAGAGEEFFYYRYHDAVKRYLELFTPGRVKIVLFDDFADDPQRIVRDVYEFLGVDPDHRPQDLGTRFNHRPDRVEAGITPAVLQHVVDRTADDTARLAALIGRDLSHWTCLRGRLG